MNNQNVRKDLYIFLASPGDLTEERKIIREVVDSLNKTFARTNNWHIQLLGWEDTLPGYGRPQEKINEDVKSCDLFLGMLWKRWGEPTGSEFTSGFEEELTLAKKRRQKEESPEIWLALKELKTEETEDPGEQLKRVLEFRQALSEKKDIFYKEFRDKEDIRKQVAEWLLEYVLKLDSQSQSISGKQETSSSLEKLTAEHKEETSQESLPAQLVKVISEISSAKINILTDSSEAEFPSLRLYLYATTLKANHISYEAFDNHDINLAYKFREKLVLTSHEKDLLFFTIIKNRSSTAPGWYWFKDVPFEKIVEDLVFLLRRFSDVQIKQAIIDILKKTNIGIDTGTFALLLADGNKEIKKAALQYVGKTGKTKDIPLIEPFFESLDAELRKMAYSSKMLIIARDEPESALLDLTKESSVSIREIIQEIEKHQERISDESLLKHAQSREEDVCIFSLRMLSKRGKLPEELSNKLIKSDFQRVSEYCYLDLIKKGKVFDEAEIKEKFKVEGTERGTLLTGLLMRKVDPDNIIFDMYKNYSAESLNAKLNWYDKTSRLAYKALAYFHCNAFSNTFRRDLENNFEDFKVRSKQALISKYGEQKAADIIDFFKKEDMTFVKEQYIRYALSGLALHGSKGDEQFARQYLNSKDWGIKLESVRILLCFGDKSDVDSLIKIAKEENGELKELAADTALRLSPGIGGAARKLLEADDYVLISLAINELFEEDIKLVWPLLRPLFKSNNENIRESIVHYAINRFSCVELEDILSEYISSESYYYNVVCFIDRFLYAVSPLKEMYIEGLRKARRKGSGLE